jgi:hypothetical protein
MISLATATLLGAGLTLAQDAGTPAGDPDHQPPPAPAQPDLTTAPLVKRAEISVSEMTGKVKEYFEKMDEILARMAELQEIARKEKDVIKLNCVTDKIAQHKELAAIADQANTNLQEAIARKDEDSRYHEFSRITIAHQQAQALAAEAENCVGEDL